MGFLLDRGSVKRGYSVKRQYWLCAILVIALAVSFIGCTKPSTTSNSSNSPTPSAAQPSNSSQGAPANTAGNPSGQQQAVAPQPVVIPAGRIIRVRLNQPLGSKTSQAGETFSATVAEPVEVDGRPVIERGAAANGTVVEAKAMGHFKGGALLQLELSSVTINGERRPVEASWSQALKGKGKRTAVVAGGGAGLGAIIGGIAGGGKGAAIGAVAGGGAGTAGAAYTGNKEIQLPAEAVVSFKLKQSVRVQ